MKHFKLGILSFTGFIVAVLSLTTWLTLFPSRSVGRGPASIPSHRVDLKLEKSAAETASVGARKELLAMQTVEINCLKPENKTLLDGAAKHIRFRTNGCKLDKVINEKNGFQATLFKTSQSITTDYVSLASGENKILIQGETAAGLPFEIFFKVFYQ